MSAAIVPLGVMRTEGRREAINSPRFSAAIFAGVDRLFCPFVELVFSPDRTVGMARTQSRPRQLANARE